MIYSCLQCGKPFKASPAARRRFCSSKCTGEARTTRVQRTCEACGKSFSVRRYKVQEGKGRFCSHACADGGWTEPCEWCGQPVRRVPYHAKTQKHVFCGRVCYGLWKRKRVDRLCEHCGKPMSVKTCDIANGEGKFCSKGCYNAARAQEMVTLICEQCGKLFTIPKWLSKGRKYCSNDCMGLAHRLPDSARSVYSHEFTETLKARIRKRDRGCCQVCGRISNNNARALTIHHIDYRKSNNHPDNLITLCHSCHSKTNYNRNEWQERLQELIS